MRSFLRKAVTESRRSAFGPKAVLREHGPRRMHLTLTVASAGKLDAAMDVGETLASVADRAAALMC